MARPILAASALAVALCFTLSAAEQTFVFGKHGAKHNNIIINSQTDLESITTTTNNVQGEMKWDRDAKSGSAKITVPVSSLNTGIKDRDEHLQGEKWLNAAKNPSITFETTSVKHKEGDQYEIAGNFTMNGVTKPVNTVATVKYIPLSPELEKAHMPKGNLARIFADFDVKLSDFNVKAPAVPANVSDTLKITIKLMGVDEVK
ncbi:MAG TPA: YceI family protein [Planctomycetota bacterium]|nr:YceI family protein [Planctomycetota bacterium]